MPPRYAKVAFQLLPLLLAVNPLLAAPSDVKIITSFSSPQPTWVYEFQGERCLSFDQRLNFGNKETCINLKAPDRLVFDYQRAAISASLSVLTPKSVLMIGLGGGTMARALQQIIPDLTLDIVEVAPEIAEAARKYFDFTPAANTRIIIKDGVEFINHTESNYDLIIIDAFHNDYIPPPFLTLDFINKAKEHLSEGGVLIANTHKGSKFSELEGRLYKEAFGQYYEITHGGNRLIMARNGQLPSMKSMDEKVRMWKKPLSSLGVAPTAFLKNTSMK